MSISDFDYNSVEFFEQRGFEDRRVKSRTSTDGRERRQFGNSYADLSEDGRRLGRAIDQYKIDNRRRFINYDELLEVFKGMGYTEPEREKSEMVR